ncbi:hypothetical protein RhiirB3_426839 [Rhizophagus irregularis]|nr:hypothetical protein RhiirB3_426839 [Rhizophagus irregularis]
MAYIRGQGFITIEYDCWAISTVVINDNLQLLISRRNDDVEALAGHWQFPGGKVEDNEECSAAALRELKEETGIEIFDKLFHWKHFHFNSSTYEGIDIFLVYTTQGSRHMEKEKNSEWIFVPLHELQSYSPLCPSIYTAIDAGLNDCIVTNSCYNVLNSGELVSLGE